MCVASFDYLGDPARTSSDAYSIAQCCNEEQAQGGRRLSGLVGAVTSFHGIGCIVPDMFGGVTLSSRGLALRIIITQRSRLVAIAPWLKARVAQGAALVGVPRSLPAETAAWPAAQVAVTFGGLAGFKPRGARLAADRVEA